MLPPLIILVFFCGSSSGLEAASSDWPQFGRTPSFQSFKNVSNPAHPPHAEWTWSKDAVGAAVDRLVASPAVFNGTVYLGSDSGHLYALDQRTGDLKWTFEQHCMPSHSEKCGGNGIRSSPAVFEDGSVVFGSYDTNVYKVSADGALQWYFKAGGSIYCPATIDQDGSVLIGTSGENCLYSLDGATGSLNWRSCGDAQGGAMNSGPAIGDSGPAGGIVVMNNYDKTIRGFDRHTGRLVWSQPGIGMGGGSATVVNGTAYIGSWNSNLYALEATTGAVLWQYDTKGSIESHPAFSDGIVYASSETSPGTLTAVEASTGRELWKYSGATEEMNGSPTLTRDLVWVGANDEYMHVLDKRSGVLRFKFKTCGNVFSSAAISDEGMAFFTCNSGTAANSGRLGDPVGTGIAYAVNPTLHMQQGAP